MESNSGDWSKSEIEQIVLWLEDPIKLRRTQKGSGETKKHWISAIASTIPSRSEAQVGYKYDNLKKSYREALKLADQSGCGLGEEDLVNGNTLSLRDKLEKKCPFFARLDAIWGTRPNFRPPSLFSSGSSSQETAAAADTLINTLQSVQNAIKIDDDEDINKNNAAEVELQSEIAYSGLSSVAHESFDMGPTRSKPSSIALGELGAHHTSTSNTYEPSPSTLHPLPTSSWEARNGKKKREFPVLEEEDDEDRKRRKKKSSTSLGDAIAAMAEKKYDFLEKQLVQQSEIRKEELKLERKKMEIREKELELETNRWNVMMQRMLGLREGNGNR
ncbi:hypothetical protein L873DRAFT_1845261 [Choiromyces venosus 120613-1]|uniref:Uncharacterized protein n=1 Tax=Choiromyces venosus 120613-1 TaxID=1336337 RepID=A0A3N4JIX8_9PEZI|nr:hypothetical protein L873DRAFT_1845261 [Choiromyces venosus 120613-1]